MVKIKPSLKNNVKFGIISLGCPKNLVDSEYTIALLENSGYLFTTRLEEAYIIIINTCSFINPSQKESVETILETLGYKIKGKCEKLIVMGCLAQLYKKKLMKEIPEIDAVVGTGDYPRMPDILSQLEETPAVMEVTSPEKLNTINLTRHRCTLTHTTYLKISEGCDHICSFCIIPLLRGPQKSRTIDSIVEEAQELADQGVREINLIAQDLTDYGRDIYGKRSLPELLIKLNEIKSIRWIRLLYTYPTFVNDELIECISSLPKLCKYIDIPFQHISDKILISMKRNTGSDKIRKLVYNLRFRIPDIVLRTTFIVGYPGESEKEFNDLLTFVSDSQFDRLGAFTYSQEKHSISYKLKPQIPDKTKDKRLDQLLDLQENIIREKQSRLMNRSLNVMLDRTTEDSLSWNLGRTYGQAPDIDGITYVANPGRHKLKPGMFVKARVTHFEGYDLFTEIID